MCLFTIILWVVLAGIVLAVGHASGKPEVTALAGLVGIGLGMVVPIVVNYWRPLFLGWARKRRNLQARLMHDGVLTNEDMEKGARMIYVWEVAPGTERKQAGSAQEAFLVIDGATLRILGEKTCVTADTFRIIPSCTGRCSRCWVIWACGGDTFRIRATVGGEERDFLAICREGRTLRAVARSTEMLEEMVESDAAHRRKTETSAETEEAAEDGASPDAPADEEAESDGKS